MDSTFIEEEIDEIFTYNILHKEKLNEKRSSLFIQFKSGLRKWVSFDEFDVLSLIN